MRSHVPCGACGALVPVTGCRHWRPRVAADEPEPAWRVAERRARDRAAEAVADFRRVMRLNDT